MTDTESLNENQPGGPRFPAPADTCRTAVDGDNSNRKKATCALRVTCQSGFSQRGGCLKCRRSKLIAGTQLGGGSVDVGAASFQEVYVPAPPCAAGHVALDRSRGFAGRSGQAMSCSRPWPLCGFGPMEARGGEG